MPAGPRYLHFHRQQGARAGSTGEQRGLYFGKKIMALPLTVDGPGPRIES